MKRMFLAVLCLCLAGAGCTSSLDSDEDVLVFQSTLRYLKAHPIHKGSVQCFEQQMLKRNASRSPIKKIDDVYGLIDNTAQKVMDRCPYNVAMEESGITRFWFYQPDITGRSATIDVDYHCGGFCGAGMTYELRRDANLPEWHVISKGQRWIS